MFLLGQLVKFIKLLNSQKGAYSIAAGFALGMTLGFVPANPLVTVALFFILCIFRIHGGATFLAWPLFQLVSYLLDPLFDRIGYGLLTSPGLKPVWTKAYNLPILPWSNFNNTIVMGSLFLSLLLFVPSIFLFKFLIDRYRASVVERMTKSKWFKVLEATKIYKLYMKVETVKEIIS